MCAGSEKTNFASGAQTARNGSPKPSHASPPGITWLICGERGELGTSGIHVGQAVRCRFLIVPSLEAARRGRGGAGTGPAGPMEIGVTLAWLLIVLSGV